MFTAFWNFRANLRNHKKELLETFRNSSEESDEDILNRAENFAKIESELYNIWDKFYRDSGDYDSWFNELSKANQEELNNLITAV
jgi:hypothetical protein